MSNENNPVKSDCPLIGENGNIFNLVGIAARTLKRNGLYEQASEMSEKVFKSGSYEEALSLHLLLLMILMIIPLNLIPRIFQTTRFLP